MYYLKAAFIIFLIPFFLSAKGTKNLNYRSTLNTYEDYSDVKAITYGNWAYRVSNSGNPAYGPISDATGLYPKNTASVIYCDGIMWGGKITDDLEQELRVGGSNFSSGTVAGSWDGNDNKIKVFHIRRDWQELSNFDIAIDAAVLFEKDFYNVTEEEINYLKNEYQSNWLNWPIELGAPFVDIDKNGEYNPVLDDNGIPQKELGDYPGIENAIMTIWYVVNDKDETITNSFYECKPLGLEIQATFWMFSSDDYSNKIFKRYEFINKSNSTIDSIYIGQWADCDIGTHKNDYAGWNENLNIGYGYNAYETDTEFDVYNLYPSAVGYKLLVGPHTFTNNDQDTAIFDFKMNSGYINIPTTSFVCRFNGQNGINMIPPANYDGAYIWYNLLRGYKETTNILEPTSYIIGSGPEQGQPTKFMLSGDPINDPTGINGDVDGQGNNPKEGDRQIILSSGPFTLDPGQKQEIIWLVGGANGSSNINSVEKLFKNMNIKKDVILNPSIPIISINEYKTEFTANDSIQINFNVKIEDYTNINTCLLRFDFEQSSSDNFEFELFDDGQHNDDEVNDGIWGSTYLTSIRQKPVKVYCVLTSNTDSLSFLLQSNFILRPIPGISGYDIIWENGTQDKLINHNEKVHIGFNIQNNDKVNSIENIRILGQPDNNFNVNILPNEIYEGSKVYYTFTAPESGDSVNIEFDLLFDGNIQNYSIKYMLQGWQPVEYWKDTLIVKNKVRPYVKNIIPIIADASLLNGQNYEVFFNESEAKLYWNLKNVLTDSLLLENQELLSSANIDGPIINGIEWKVFNYERGINAIVEENQDGDLIDANISISIPGYMSNHIAQKGYIVSNRGGTVNYEDFTRDFSRFNYWNDDDLEINFNENSLTWDYTTEKVHFNSSNGLAYYAPFSVYRYNSETGDKLRLFAGFWDIDNSGTWNIAYDESEPEFTCPVNNLPSYEPIYCWVGYDINGNEINYDPTKDAIYTSDNSLGATTTANTTWGSATGEFIYPYVTATLFAMKDEEATLPIGNKVMFYLNKELKTIDTLVVIAEATKIKNAESIISNYRLFQNFPNPFNLETKIEFKLPQRTNVKIEVYNVLGQRVNTLVNKSFNRGKHTLIWNGTDENNNIVSSGIYFYKLKADGFSKSKKMILIK